MPKGELLLRQGPVASKTSTPERPVGQSLFRRRRVDFHDDTGGIMYGTAVGISMAVLGGLVGYAHYNGDIKATIFSVIIGGVIGVAGGAAMDDNQPIF